MPPRPVPEAGPSLRVWQRRALVEYLRRRDEDFLAVATPGAGKTTFALRIAAELLADGTVDAVTVVTPTEHLKSQWAARRRPGRHPARPRLPQRRRALLVRLPRRRGHVRAGRHGPRRPPAAHDDPEDPGHPRRDPPRRRLALLGRRGEVRLRAGRTAADAHRHPVPLRRQPDPVRRRTSAARTAWPDPGPTSPTATPTPSRDGVVRPVIFLAYSGETRWRTIAGDELAARLGEPMTQDLIAQAWRTALDPTGDWMPQVLRAADARLQVKRAGGMPDAGRSGDRQRSADGPGVREAARPGSPARRPSWCSPTTSGASGRIAVVRRVGPALDGRGTDGVRGRRHPAPGRRRVRHQRLDPAVLRPGDRPVRAGPPAGGDRDGLPAERAAPARAGQRDGGPARPRPRRAEGRRTASTTTCSSAPSGEEQASGELEKTFEALSATAELDQVIFDGATFGMPAQSGTPEEEEYLGLPGLLSADQVAALLTKRQAEQVAAAKRRAHGRDGGGDARSSRPGRGPRGSGASCCVVSSTRWWPRTTTGPGCRTARSTPSCGGCAVARRARRPRSSSWRSGSRPSRRSRQRATGGPTPKMTAGRPRWGRPANCDID